MRSTDAKPTDADRPIVGYAVRFRSFEKGARWKTIAVVRTCDAALDHVDRSGNWHLEPIRDPALLANAEPLGLFD